MALIKPFKGIRFSESLEGDTGSLLTPPYDVISPEMQDQLHDKNPYNIVRLEFGKRYTEDSSSDNPYTRAATTLDNWLEENILIYDQTPAFYFYDQQFLYNGEEFNRRGFFAALKLEPYSKKVVLPHEKTMSGPKEDRLALLKRSRTNISPIFTLFQDPDNQMEEFFSAAEGGKTIYRSVETDGQKHSLIAVTDPDLQEKLSAFIAPKQILIADGHHRYETALRFHLESGDNEDSGSAYVLVALIPTNQPGLLMLPTHRILSGIGEDRLELLKARAGETFTVVNMGNLESVNHSDYLDSLDQVSRNKGGFGMITRDGLSLLVPATEKAGQDLPVTTLHRDLLEPILKDDVGLDAKSDQLSFSHDFAASLEAVKSGAADVAFILSTIPVEKVFSMGADGVIMPQKSTYFYPKLPGGLVLRHMEKS